MGRRVDALLLEHRPVLQQGPWRHQGGWPGSGSWCRDETIADCCQTAANPPDLFGARRTGCASGSSGSRSCGQSVAARRYLKKFSCDQRWQPSTCSKGICGWVVITGTCRPLATAPNLAHREPVAQHDRLLGELQRLVPAGPWTGTSRAQNFAGQSSPLKFLCQVMQAAAPGQALNRSGLQPSRSNTRVAVAACVRSRHHAQFLGQSCRSP